MSWGLILDGHAAVLFTAAAIFVALRPPPRPLRPGLLWVQLAALLWIIGDIGTLIAGDLRTEQVSIAVLYAGSLAMPALWWRLALGFSEDQGVEYPAITDAMRQLPLAFAVLAWLFVATNPWHGEFLTPVVGGRNEYHWMWWTTAPALHLLTVGTLTLFCTTYARLPAGGEGRRQCRLMILATVAGLTTNAAYTLSPIDWPFDITVFGGIVTGLLFIGGVYSRNVVDIPPFMLQEVLQGDPAGLLLVQDDGALLYANPRANELLGPPGLPLDRPAWYALSERLVSDEDDDAPVTADDLEARLREEQPRGARYRVKDVEPTRWLWLTGARLPARREGPPDVAVRIRDVSPLQDLVEQKRAISSQLREAEGSKATGVLTAGIAHEINNPIGSLMLSTEFAVSERREEADPTARTELARTALAVAFESSERVQAILASMMRFAANEPGDRVEASLDDVIRHALEATRELTARLGTRVSFEPVASLPPTRMNPSEIDQVFVNLIQNAAQSGGTGRSVEIATEAAGPYVRATVSDDGPGMTPDQVARAFEPFQTWRRERGGTGLGLSVVHGIVEAHGGSTRIESELGHGTRVIVELPVASRA